MSTKSNLAEQRVLAGIERRGLEETPAASSAFGTKHSGGGGPIRKRSASWNSQMAHYGQALSKALHADDKLAIKKALTQIASDLSLTVGDLKGYVFTPKQGADIERNVREVATMIANAKTPKGKS